EVAHTQQQAGTAPVRQHKLEVSSPGDTLEVEADRAADAMVGGRTAQLASRGSASGALHRSILPKVNGSPGTISYPAGLLAACPSLALAGDVEQHGGTAALQALATSAGNAEKLKVSFDASWKKVAGIDITELSAADGKAITDTTKDPGADNKARTSTEAVMEAANRVSDD